MIGIQRARTNQRLKSADLRRRLKIKIKTKRAGFKTRPPAFVLDRVIILNFHVIISCYLYAIHSVKALRARVYISASY